MRLKLNLDVSTLFLPSVCMICIVIEKARKGAREVIFFTFDIYTV
jgi:hypothetical protein